MKKAFLYIGMVSALLGSCTKDFNELNTNPTAIPSEQMEPNYMLSRTQYNYANTGYSQLLFQSMWTQVFASTFNYYSNGDKYVGSANLISYQNRIWEEDYQAASIATEIGRLAKDKGLDNLYNASVIMRILIMQHVTDCYGDVPYSEAFKAREGVVSPVYDTQESIYKSMLAELETVTAALDPSKDALTADLFYKGNIAQWKKLGYSLMLRTAMRLTKADAATARTYAEKAAAGGTFAGVADNARVMTDNSANFGNGTSAALLVTDDYRDVKWSKVLIDYMRRNNDPRLTIIGEIPQAGLKANEDASKAGDRDSSRQLGMPNGYDQRGGATDISRAPGYPGGTGPANDFAPLGNYSRPTTALYTNRSGVEFVLTYAETELLLAEAAVRGWNVGGTAAAHYANGLTGALQSMATFNAEIGTFTPTQISSYVNAHPLDQSSTEASLKQINEQYWATTGTLFNFIETWCNWRRSGYPQLTPVVYVGNFSGGTIPRRIPYHSTEGANNPSGYQDAVSRLGGTDNFTSRMWWDK
ncbi:SusD/RagB family nutrient-binding outer membrane lipoprotein [uncultured Chitinophaga sp.]|jgi:hypothetical protein|uniref:SusD/RagB family nutrient-binding outer membrane lipoprotein n=1 Tax=uncultured Chitinophaga sp. TaxID=339340 RepID=UPI002617D517|nr:SusD/RagB family nutrient-binding outer membrane lipoprotein [uncultured Chitinophaga sp.]